MWEKSKGTTQRKKRTVTYDVGTKIIKQIWTLGYMLKFGSFILLLNFTEHELLMNSTLLLKFNSLKF